MPGVTSKSILAQKLGAKLIEAHRSTKDKEPSLDGGGGLPPGIDNGIARLVTCRIAPIQSGDYKGQPGFYADAVILEPVTHAWTDEAGHVQQAKVQGKRTRLVTIPLCDTQKTVNGQKVTVTFVDNYNRMTDVLKRLGLKSYLRNLPPTLSPDAFEDALLKGMAMLIKGGKDGKGTCFGFRTWKGAPSPAFPNPRVNETWGEAMDYDAAKPAPAVQDDTGKGNGVASGPVNRITGVGPATKPGGKPAVAGKATTVAEEPAANGGMEDDGGGTTDPDADGALTDLAGRATEDDQEAKDQLEAIAIQYGLIAQDVNDAPSWEALVTMICRAAGVETDDSAEGSSAEGDVEGEGDTEEGAEAGDGDEGAPSEETPWEPEKGQIYMYRITAWDAKAKKAVKAKKAAECEVLTVNKEKRTVTLKELDTGKPVTTADSDHKKRKTLAISWDDLESGEG